MGLGTGILWPGHDPLRVRVGVPPSATPGPHVQYGLFLLESRVTYLQQGAGTDGLHQDRTAPCPGTLVSDMADPELARGTVPPASPSLLPRASSTASGDEQRRAAKMIARGTAKCHRTVKCKPRRTNGAYHIEDQGQGPQTRMDEDHERGRRIGCAESENGCRALGR